MWAHETEIGGGDKYLAWRYLNCASSANMLAAEKKHGCGGGRATAKSWM